MRNYLACAIGLWALLAVGASSPVQAQSGSRIPAKIIGIDGRTRLYVDEEQNFRVRLIQGVAWPVEYLWDFGDGAAVLAEGNNVAYRFARPGQYVVKVGVRNRWGSDEHTKVVTVVARPVTAMPDSVKQQETTLSPGKAVKAAVEAPAVSSNEAALRSARAVDPARGGYTWMVATYLERPIAEGAAYQLRQQGYRVGIIEDGEGPGSLAYRVVVGQFPTERAALAARRKLPEEYPGVWLMSLAPGAEE